jgi:hypothetical protein
MEKKKMSILKTTGSSGGVFVVVLLRGRNAAYTTHLEEREREGIEEGGEEERKRDLFSSSLSLSVSVSPAFQKN